MTPTQLAQALPPQPRQRREILSHEMGRLEKQGIDCFSCTGVCCTFVANSMMTTPLETAELLIYLVQQNRWNPTTIAILQETVRRYRLDQEPPGDGRRSFTRRTYTCPFFGQGALGCSISRSAKPYGCLGFNAQQAGVTEGGFCGSNTDLLSERDQQFALEEDSLNQRLKNMLGLDWEKQPMPHALLLMAGAMDWETPGLPDAPANSHL